MHRCLGIATWMSVLMIVLILQIGLSARAANAEPFQCNPECKTAYQSAVAQCDVSCPACEVAAQCSDAKKYCQSNKIACVQCKKKRKLCEISAETTQSLCEQACWSRRVIQVHESAPVPCPTQSDLKKASQTYNTLKLQQVDVCNTIKGVLNSSNSWISGFAKAISDAAQCKNQSPLGVIHDGSKCAQDVEKKLLLEQATTALQGKLQAVCGITKELLKQGTELSWFSLTAFAVDEAAQCK